MKHDPPQCPGCEAALLIDAPFNFLERWPEVRLRFGFNAVALGGGWEKCGLEHAVSVDSEDATSCDAVYVGDVITNSIVCPRCGHPIYDVLNNWLSER